MSQQSSSTTATFREARTITREARPIDFADDSILVSYHGYKSQITPRSVSIGRRGGNSSGRIAASTLFSSSSSSLVSAGNFNYGIPLKPTNQHVLKISENREKEKRELIQLNDKFAAYVERVRFLEVHNKKLQMELEALKNRAGQESSKIREMFEVEISEARRLIDESSKDKANAETKATTSISEMKKFESKYYEVIKSRDADKARIEDLNKQIANNEAEINLLKRRLGDLEDEIRRQKIETQRLLNEIQRVTADLDGEVMLRVQLDNEKLALEEELNFLRQMHAAQLDELRKKSFLDVGIDSSQFFKSELANAIRAIRDEYEKLNGNNRNEMEQMFRFRVQEVHTRFRPEPNESVMMKEEVRKIRTTITDLRREIAGMKGRNEVLEAKIREIEDLMEAEKKDGLMIVSDKEAEFNQLTYRLNRLTEDYDELIKMKISLEEEIATYRSLLEGDSKKDGLKQVVENIEERARQSVMNVTFSSGALSNSSSFSGDSMMSNLGGSHSSAGSSHYVMSMSSSSKVIR